MTERLRWHIAAVEVATAVSLGVCANVRAISIHFLFSFMIPQNHTPLQNSCQPRKKTLVK